MHELFSYSGKVIEQDVELLRNYLSRIQREGNPSTRRAYRSQVHRLSDRLIRWQRELATILDKLEADWDLYPDEGDLESYYNRIEELYLLAGGHWAGKQESGPVHRLTHQPPACPTCGQGECVCNGLKPLPECVKADRDTALPKQYSRGRAKLFKS